ncbi:MAG: hypothetical protein WBA15_00900 [Mesorhizobium sp.]
MVNGTGGVRDRPFDICFERVIHLAMITILACGIKGFSIFEFFWVAQVNPDATAQFIRLIDKRFMFFMREPLLGNVFQ